MARLPRRKVLLTAGLCLAALAAAWAALPSSPPPNVLVIVVDTCRADRCAFNGYTRPNTPALEEFRRDAVTFTDAWSPACWTAPGHASLFTGLRPESHGMMEGVRIYLDPSCETVAQRLSAAGWSTAAFSNNPVVSPELQLTTGFELFVPMYEVVGDRLPTSQETHAKVLSWLRTRPHPERPFFVFVNHMEPHLPYRPVEQKRKEILASGVSAKLLERSLEFDAPLSVVHGLGIPIVDDPMRSLLSRLYDEEVSIVDAEIGKLLKSLDQMGLLDNTLVVITSDHGENIGDHGLYDHRMSLNRTVLHIPLIVRLPGTFDGGREVKSVVRLEDVTSTIYEATGVTPPEGLQGLSLTHDLDGRIARAVHGSLLRNESMVRANFPSVDTSRLAISLRSTYDGRHHLIRYSDGRDELFDLSEDPGELHDLSAREPLVLERMRRLDDDR